MMRFVGVLVVGIGVFGTGAVAQSEPEVRPEVVQQCFESSRLLGRGLPGCVGDALSECLLEFGDTTLSRVQCTVSETAEWDLLLNMTYQAVRPALVSRDVQFGYAVSTADALLEAQRAWIAFRDAECGLQWAMYQDGSIRGPIAAACRLEMTAARVFELRALMEP